LKEKEWGMRGEDTNLPPWLLGLHLRWCLLGVRWRDFGHVGHGLHLFRCRGRFLTPWPFGEPARRHLPFPPTERTALLTTVTTTTTAAGTSRGSTSGSHLQGTQTRRRRGRQEEKKKRKGKRERRGRRGKEAAAVPGRGRGTRARRQSAHKKRAV